MIENSKASELYELCSEGSASVEFLQAEARTKAIGVQYVAIYWDRERPGAQRKSDKKTKTVCVWAFRCSLDLGT